MDNSCPLCNFSKEKAPVLCCKCSKPITGFPVIAVDTIHLQHLTCQFRSSTNNEKPGYWSTAAALLLSTGWDVHFTDYYGDMVPLRRRILPSDMEPCVEAIFHWCAANNVDVPALRAVGWSDQRIFEFLFKSENLFYLLGGDKIALPLPSIPSTAAATAKPPPPTASTSAQSTAAKPTNASKLPPKPIGKKKP